MPLKQMNCTKHIVLIFMMALMPSICFAAQQESLQERVAQRRAQRANTNIVRIGKSIRTTSISPRRRQISTLGVVTHVIDGSVFQVLQENGTTTIVHTLGSEAPVLKTGSSSQQCFANEAKRRLSILLQGNTVELIKDRNFATDNQGRLLRYVHLGTMDIGNKMIENGYAFADTKNAYNKRESYGNAQSEAQKYERGLWSHGCEYNENLDTIEVQE